MSTKQHHRIDRVCEHVWIIRVYEMEIDPSTALRNMQEPYYFSCVAQIISSDKAMIMTGAGKYDVHAARNVRAALRSIGIKRGVFDRRKNGLKIDLDQLA